MNTLSTTVPLIAAVLAFISGASYLFPQEGIRGAGRVIGGIAFVFLGFYFGFVLQPAIDRVLDAAAAMFVVSGVVTVVCGARKFMRR
jgi:hypothetical protein